MRGRWRFALRASTSSGNWTFPCASENEVPFEDKPFKIKVADRVNPLLPYMFGKINKLKYQKRVAGVDVIDLGMEI